MAFIATYISTTGASELATFWDEASEGATAQAELFIKDSFDWVNEHLDTFIQTPIPVQPTTGRYPATVRAAQKLKAIHLYREFFDGPEADISVKAGELADLAIEKVMKGKAQIEAMYSQDEIGFNYPIAGSSNTSTALLEVDRQASYTGDTERIYTITATSSADVETATFTWANGEGTTDTGNTSDYDWIAIEDGLSIRWKASPSGGKAIVSTDTWKIRCVPETVKPDAPGNMIGSISARN